MSNTKRKSILYRDIPENKEINFPESSLSLSLKHSIRG